MNTENNNGSVAAQPLRLLIVEDSPRDAELVIREIQRGGFDVAWKRVDTAEAMKAALDAEPWDAIVSDYRMPSFEGLAALRVVQATGAEIPFIIVSGTIGEDIAAAAMKAGAHDYLMKDKLARLAPAIERELREATVRRERKRLEDATREATRQWRTTFDAMRDAVALLDLEGKIVRCNAALRDLIGKSWDEIVGQPCCRIVHGLNNPPSECPAARAARSLKRETWQTTIGDRWFDVVADPVLDDAGGVTGIVHVMTDITERKRAEKRQVLHARLLDILNRPNAWERLLSDLLREIKAFTGFDAVGIRLREGEDFPYFVQNGFSEDFIATERSLCERTPTGEVVRDSAGNPVLACMCGNVIQGRTNPALPFFTVGGSFWTNSTTQLLVTADEQNLQARTRNRCNREGYESVALIPLRSGNDIIGLLQLNDRRPDRLTADVIHFFEDIGNSIGVAFTRMRMEQALRDSESKHRLLFETSRDAIMTLAPPSWKFTSGNPATVAMFGTRDETDFTSRAPWEYSPERQPDGRPSADKAKEMIETAMRDGSHFFEWTHKRLNGEDFPATVLLSRFELGGQTLLQATVRDITREQELKAKLQQAQKLEAVGTLAGGVAHEINNPIMGIMNYADLIGDRAPKDSQTAEYAGEIKRETERVATIVKNLLGFARQDKQSRSPARMCDIVEATLSLIRTVMRHDQITLAVDVPEDLPMIKCRSQQIQQVVMNLITNARDALNTRYPGFDEDKKIRISAEVVRHPSSVVSHQLPEKATPITDHRSLITDTIRLTVEDHGCGIPEAIRQRIFDPFFTTKPRDKGTGLGLSISHGIVKDHGGALSVESEPRQWTRFYVDLPIADCEMRNAK
jgi:PAS domain S-box-containing protein